MKSALFCSNLSNIDFEEVTQGMELKGSLPDGDILPKLPPADEEGRVKIWSSYSNCLDPEKEVPLREDGVGDLLSRI